MRTSKFIWRWWRWTHKQAIGRASTFWMTWMLPLVRRHAISNRFNWGWTRFGKRWFTKEFVWIFWCRREAHNVILFCSWATLLPVLSEPNLVSWRSVLKWLILTSLHKWWTTWWKWRICWIIVLTGLIIKWTCFAIYIIIIHDLWWLCVFLFKVTQNRMTFLKTFSYSGNFPWNRTRFAWHVRIWTIVNALCIKYWNLIFSECRLFYFSFSSLIKIEKNLLFFWQKPG